jgi:class 3 adenylate cyclase
MIETDENRTFTICQATKHAMLIPWGRFARHLKLSERLQAAITLRRHKDAAPGADLLLEFGLASLAGYECLQDLNLGSHPLAKDQAVQDAWNIQFRHYTTVSRFLYELDETNVTQVQTELDAIMRPYIRSAVHTVLCQQECLTLCGDLTGRPISAYSSTYPPDAVFGYMANQLRKGHQAVLVTLKGRHRRIHIAAFHHSGNTVSSVCLREMVEAAESRLGCRPRRRTELLRQRIETVGTKIAQRQHWGDAQQTVIRRQIERQIRLGNQLQALKPQLTELEARYEGKPVRPNSKLAQVRQQKASWERQLRSALEQESQARRALRQHQRRLETLISGRDALLRWLAHLEADNATLPNPVRIRWLLDGGFGDAANVTYLIEMGYDVYTIAHNGKTSQALLKEVPLDAAWTQAGTRTQALETERHTLGQCPYPVRLTLLRWLVGDTFKHSTLISFSDGEELPTADLFPTYHERQDVEAGIKQGKGTFSFTKLRVRSPAGIRLLGQFALVFWPNFVRWAADWLIDQVRDEKAHFARVLQQVRTQVRIAANTSAVVLTNTSGQMLEFDADGPYAGVQIRLDGLFAYQFPMPLFQSWEQLWPVSSESVKEQVSAMMTDKDSLSLVDALFARPSARLPEKVPKIEVLERFVL